MWATPKGEATLGACAEDNGEDSEDWSSILDWNWDLGIGVVWEPGNAKPEIDRPEKPGSGKPGSGKPGTGKPGTGKPGTDKPEIGHPEKPDNSTTRPEYPEKPADCKCPRLPLKQRQLKTGIQYEYAQNDGELTIILDKRNYVIFRWSTCCQFLLSRRI